MVPWRIHPQNRTPIGGDGPGAHIIPELPPLYVFETREEAEAKFSELIGHGVKDIYLLGPDA